MIDARVFNFMRKHDFAKACFQRYRVTIHTVSTILDAIKYSANYCSNKEPQPTIRQLEIINRNAKLA